MDLILSPGQSSFQLWPREMLDLTNQFSQCFLKQFIWANKSNNSGSNWKNVAVNLSRPTLILSFSKFTVVEDVVSLAIDTTEALQLCPSCLFTRKIDNELYKAEHF